MKEGKKEGAMPVIGKGLEVSVAMGYVSDHYVKVMRHLGVVGQLRADSIELVNRYVCYCHPGGEEVESPHGIIHARNSSKLFNGGRKVGAMIMHVLPEEDKLEIDLALLYAWTRPSGIDSGKWARAHFNRVTGGAMPEIAEKLYRLVLAVRGEIDAETDDEKIIVRIGLLADGLVNERPTRPNK